MQPMSESEVQQLRENLVRDSGNERIINDTWGLGTVQRALIACKDGEFELAYWIFESLGQGMEQIFGALRQKDLHCDETVFSELPLWANGPQEIDLVMIYMIELGFRQPASKLSYPELLKKVRRAGFQPCPVEAGILLLLNHANELPYRIGVATVPFPVPSGNHSCYYELAGRSYKRGHHTGGFTSLHCSENLVVFPNEPWIFLKPRKA